MSSSRRLEDKTIAMWFEDGGTRLSLLMEREIMTNQDPCYADVCTGYFVDSFLMNEAYGTSGEMTEQPVCSDVPKQIEASRLTQSNNYYSVIPGSNGRNKPANIVNKCRDDRLYEHFGTILGVSPIEPYCILAGKPKEEDKLRYFVCKTLWADRGHEYRLSRFSEIQGIIRRDMEAEGIEEQFKEALSQGNGQKAKYFLDKYRKLDGRAESETAFDMEREMSKIVKKKQLHHVTEIDPNTVEFHPAHQPYRDVKVLEIDSGTEYADDFGEQLLAAAKTAMRKAFSVRNLLTSGNKALLGRRGDYWMSHISNDGLFGYASISGNFHNSCVRVNIKDNSLAVLKGKNEIDRKDGTEEDEWFNKHVSEMGTDYKEALSPDGIVLVKRDWTEHDNYFVESRMGKTFLGEKKSTSRVEFSDDGFYLAVSNGELGKYDAFTDSAMSTKSNFRTIIANQN